MNTNTAKLVNDLKEAIKEEEVVKEYLSAMNTYISDGNMITLVNEYNVQTGIYETESAKEEKDELLLTSIKSRIDVLAKEIAEKESMRRLIAAENDINQFYNELFGILQSVVMPEQHNHSCNGDCSGCSGCH